MRKVLIVVLIAAALTLFLGVRKKTLAKHATRWLESCLAAGTDLQFHIGKISGNALGFIKFQDVEVSQAGEGLKKTDLFKAKEIRFRYTLLEFLAKKSSSKIEVFVADPVFYWRPHVTLKTPSFPLMGLLQQWASAKDEDRVTIRIKGLTLYFGYENQAFKGIDFTYRDNSFEITLPVSHAAVGGTDLSSIVRLTGRFEPGTLPLGDVLTGQIWTEGTVVNWKPMKSESRFDFVFTGEDFRLTSTDFLGGLDVNGTIRFSRDTPIDLVIQAEDYPLSHFGIFLKTDPRLPVPGLLDMEMRFSGSFWQPRLERRMRIVKGWLGKTNFRAVDIHLQGVMPTLEISDSRILLEDGSVMRFADKTLEIHELLRPKTYNALIEEAHQESVMMGDWSFSRPKDMKDKPEFLMRRALSDDAKDFFKVSLMEDEEFVGVERKVKF